MMKDIQLVKSGANTYDWSFNGVDVNTVAGNLQLVQAVKHAVLLKPNELIQDVYKGKGCRIHNYILSGNDPDTLELKSATVEEAVKEVHNVSDAQCSITSTDYDNQIQLSVITDQMQVVTVDEI